MRALVIALSLGLALAACKAEEKKPDPTPASAEPAAPATPFVPPAEAAAPTAPAEPEPTTPAEIEEARKKAMLEGRDADVIKYCELAGVTTDSGDGQAALGCALAACRLGDPASAEKAKAWAKKLPKALKQQANQICMANKVVL